MRIITSSLILSLISLSIVGAVPSLTPSGGSDTRGAFAIYFDGIKTANPCFTGQAIRSFDPITFIPQCGYLFWAPNAGGELEYAGNVKINGDLTANNLNLTPGSTFDLAGGAITNVSNIDTQNINTPTINNYPTSSLINLGFLSSLSPGKIPRATSANSIGDSNIYEDSTGRIGIGNTSPQVNLDILGSSQLDGIQFYKDLDTTNGIGQLAGIHNWNGTLSIGNFDGAFVYQNSRMLLHPNGRTEVGLNSQDYLPGSRNWNYTMQLNGQDNTSIGFHDDGASVSSIRYNNGGFTIGGDDGWGTKPVTIPGKLNVEGGLKISGGNAGDVLTKNTSGDAEWKALGGAGFYMHRFPDDPCSGGWCEIQKFYMIANPGTECTAYLGSFNQNYRYGNVSCNYNRLTGYLEYHGISGAWGSCAYICMGSNTGGYPTPVGPPPPPPAFCGNSLVESGEICDDGTNIGGLCGSCKSCTSIDTTMCGGGGGVSGDGP